MTNTSSIAHKARLPREALLHDSKSVRAGIVGALMFLVYVVLVIKLVTLQSLDDAILFATYSILISFYILSRFFLAYFYLPQTQLEVDTNYTPFITFVTPAKDEEGNIAKTLSAMMRTDYPKDKFEIITVNDGSTDNTASEMYRVQKIAHRKKIQMSVIDWKRNRGKRDGMAEGARFARGEIIIFVDSDSFVVPSTARELIKYFRDPTIAAVAGHAEVENHSENLLTKMQTVRYFVAFKAYKSAEALFGTVTCCSGCCSAYRTAHVREILDAWVDQKFMNVRCTYGDDRSLTNYLLQKGYRAIYAPEAYSTTVVPSTWRTFLKQQMRWKKSWTRESFRALRFIWKRHPIMAISFILGVVLPLLAPVIVIRAMLWLPLAGGVMPWVYISGLVLMSIIYGVYYRLYRKDSLWIYGMFFSWFYSLILVWQLPYAILRLRDARWGTR